MRDNDLDGIDGLAETMADASAEIERLEAELAGRGWCDKHEIVAGCPGCIEVEMRRLRATLENIIHVETHDMDGSPLPESGAAFIARQALAGASDETERCRKCGEELDEDGHHKPDPVEPLL